MGALSGIRVIEMAGIGPAPFCAMLLADMGAEVLRIDRLVAADLGIPVPPKFDLLNRNKRSLAVDLKSPAGRDTMLRLIGQADALIEGFRPGVMERLGLGPAPSAAVNPRLVYGRVTGWGQYGPLSHAASHDINYIALGGVLNAVGAKDGSPVIPLNLVGDFGGGALYLAMGILAAMISSRATGRGQIVDASITDGVASLLTMHYGLRQAGEWSLDRKSNLTDGGAPFYDVYRTCDGLYVSVGSVEKKFFAELLRRLGLSAAEIPEQHDRAAWDRQRRQLAEVFAGRTRAEWCELLEGTDACFAPVLDMDECMSHPHHAARGTYVDFAGVKHPAPAPRFSGTPSELRSAPPAPGQHTAEALRDWSFSESEIDDLKNTRAVA